MQRQRWNETAAVQNLQFTVDSLRVLRAESERLDAMSVASREHTPALRGRGGGEGRGVGEGGGRPPMVPRLPSELLSQSLEMSSLERSPIPYERTPSWVSCRLDLCVSYIRIHVHTYANMHIHVHTRT